MSAVAQLALTVTGWTGAISAVVAYGLVTTKRISPDSLLFQGLNIVGAGLLCISASVYGAWPSAIVNVIWVAIGIVAIRTMFRHHHKRPVAGSVANRSTDLARTAAVDAMALDRRSLLV